MSTITMHLCARCDQPFDEGPPDQPIACPSCGQIKLSASIPAAPSSPSLVAFVVCSVPWFALGVLYLSVDPIYWQILLLQIGVSPWRMSFVYLMLGLTKDGLLVFLAYKTSRFLWNILRKPTGMANG